MRKRNAFAVFLMILYLSGCAAQTAAAAPAAPTTMPAPTTQPATESAVYVSPVAQEDFLDLESASEERKVSPELVMLHFTSAVMLDRENPFDYGLVRGIFEDNRLGIHYIIDRSGKVYCFVPEDRAAWHAGNGSFGEEKYTDNMNQYAIGIELLAIGSQKDMSIYLHPQEYDALPEEYKGFTTAQYTALTQLVRDICTRNGILMDREHILGHQEYKPEKNDPGELFDWQKLMGLLQDE
ncbi:MAG: N-acetylmuramoyl-L-alanine amidase [Ruminococcaceae bacterium]|nr:N-acetylmuramoyl-L-alanine amidase [Oscillospiraceae bacterium]